MISKGRKVSGEASKARKAAPTDGWTFSVRQGGEVVASGCAPTEGDAFNEARHYALMYAQDGAPVTATWARGPTPSPSGQRRSGSVSQKKKASTP